MNGGACGRRAQATACADEVVATGCYSKTINQRELHNQSGKVLREVAGGARITITNRGTPVAELRPVARSKSISRDEIAQYLKCAPKIDAKRFREDLDSVVNQKVI
jgi:prevent-host-death family protein